MPFLNHFGLKEHPFSLTPNPALFFGGRLHRPILEMLSFALKRGDGVLTVVGDVGTGKTMLCRLLLQVLDGEAALAYLHAPLSDDTDIARDVAREFGLDVGPHDDAFHILNRFLLEQHSAGRRAVLVIDEAQSLGRPGLETIRLLSNLETEYSKLLQTVMFGQPELDALLQQHALRQLNQRIAFRFETRALTARDASRYVQHRVHRCSINGDPREMFTKSALAMLARHSRGVPRVINILADKAMLAAYAENVTTVRRRHMVAAIDDSPSIAQKLAFFRRWNVARLAGVG
ncbi:MAG: AAA family ATPase [Pseudomonadota bacterium]